MASRIALKVGNWTDYITYPQLMVVPYVAGNDYADGDLYFDNYRKPAYPGAGKIAKTKYFVGIAVRDEACRQA